MARDLIPPPSPAGRSAAPDGHAAHLSRAAAGAAAASPSRRRSRRARSRRRSSATASGSWSARWPASCSRRRSCWRRGLRPTAADPAATTRAWRRTGPSGSRRTRRIAGGAAEIAEKVGGRVPAPERQAARSGAAVFTGELPLEARRPAAITDLIGDTGRLPAWTASGRAGRSRASEPSRRGAVVHREALELALYTFRYLPDAESVMVLLPPPPPDAATTAANAEVAQQAAAGDQEAAAPAGGARAAGEDAQPRDLLPPGRPQAAAAGPARRDAPGGRPERRRRSRKAEADDDRHADVRPTCSPTIRAAGHRRHPAVAAITP